VWLFIDKITYALIHDISFIATHTHPFNGPFSGTITASEMTYTESSGALNSTPTNLELPGCKDVTTPVHIFGFIHVKT